MRQILKLVLVLALIPATGFAAELDLNLNADAVRVTLAGRLTDTKLRLDGGLLHEKNRGNVGHVGLHLVGEASTGPQPVIAGVGGRFVYLDSDRVNADGYGFGVGGFVRYTVPNHNRVELGGWIYFAPEILMGGDAEEYFEFDVYAGYSILRDALLYIGYRDISADFEQRSGVTMESGGHIGFRLKF